MDIVYSFLSSPLMMLVYGLATHFLKDIARLKSEGQSLGVKDYWKKFPLQTLISVIGAVAGFSVLHETGQLSGVTAFGIGYMANSVADIIGKRSMEKIK